MNSCDGGAGTRPSLRTNPTTAEDEPLSIQMSVQPVFVFSLLSNTGKNKKSKLKPRLNSGKTRKFAADRENLNRHAPNKNRMTLPRQRALPQHQPRGGRSREAAAHRENNRERPLRASRSHKEWTRSSSLLLRASARSLDQTSILSPMTQRLTARAISPSKGRTKMKLFL